MKSPTPANAVKIKDVKKRKKKEDTTNESRMAKSTDRVGSNGFHFESIKCNLANLVLHSTPKYRKSKKES